MQGTFHSAPRTHGDRLIAPCIMDGRRSDDGKNVQLATIVGSVSRVGLTNGSGATGSVFVNDQACSGPVMFMKPHPGAGSRSSSFRRSLRSSVLPAAGACCTTKRSTG